VKRWLFACFALMLLSGCSSMTSKMADNLNTAILNQNDLETVRQGAPAYLIMIDSFIEGAPDDIDLLVAGSGLYSAYSGAFVSNPDRARLMSEKALDYAHKAVCIEREDLCDLRTQSFQEFETSLPDIDEDDLNVIYPWAVALAGWIQARSDDWNAIADIPRVKAVMQRVVEINPAYDRGGAQLYLGVLNSLLPPAMGGKPETAKAHFEQALKLSEGKNLMVKTLYAQYYARITFNQELHDRLLKEVLESPVNVPGLTLINTLAQEQARQLLAESPDYF
jgi:tetratricopeptide (TPR) repeat protein